MVRMHVTILLVGGLFSRIFEVIEDGILSIIEVDKKKANNRAGLLRKQDDDEEPLDQLLKNSVRVI